MIEREAQYLERPPTPSPAQKWQLARQHPHWHNNTTCVLQLPESMSVQRVQAAFRQVWTAHDGLRVLFMRTLGQWTGVLATTDETLSLRLVSCTDQDHAGDLDETLEECLENSQSLLNISNGPTAIVYLVHSNEEVHHVAILKSHITSDFLSFQRILSDIDLALQGQCVSPTFAPWRLYDAVAAHLRSRVAPEVPAWTPTSAPVECWEATQREVCWDLSAGSGRLIQRLIKLTGVEATLVALCSELVFPDRLCSQSLRVRLNSFGRALIPGLTGRMLDTVGYFALNRFVEIPARAVLEAGQHYAQSLRTHEALGLEVDTAVALSDSPAPLRLYQGIDFGINYLGVTDATLHAGGAIDECTEYCGTYGSSTCPMEPDRQERLAFSFEFYRRTFRITLGFNEVRVSTGEANWYLGTVERSLGRLAERAGVS